MSIFLQRTALFLVAAVLQHSFLDILWPSFPAPALMISLVVTLVFLQGFERGGLWALFALLLFMVLGTVDSRFVLFAVAIAYGTSFLSRRLVIERSLQTSFVLAVASAGCTLMYSVVVFLIDQNTWSSLTVFFNMLETVLVFPFVFLVFRKWEQYATESFMSAFRGMRT